jgi:hypothetical protein
MPHEIQRYIISLTTPPLTHILPFTYMSFVPLLTSFQTDVHSAASPRSVYLTGAPVILHCASSQVNNYPAVSTTGLFGKQSYWCTTAKYSYMPGHCYHVPTTRALGHPSHSTTRMMLSARKSLVCFSRTHESWKRNQVSTRQAQNHSCHIYRLSAGNSQMHRSRDVADSRNWYICQIYKSIKRGFHPSTTELPSVEVREN